METSGKTKSVLSTSLAPLVRKILLGKLYKTDHFEELEEITVT